MRNESLARYRAENRETLNAKARAVYDPERERERQTRPSAKVKRKQAKQRWWSKNKEKMACYYRNYRAVPDERERRNEWNRKYKTANKAIVNAQTRLRRARKQSATVSGLPQGWDKDFYQEALNAGMQVDHIIPLAPCRICGLTGKHEPSNLQLLTKSENVAKNNRCQECWEASRGDLAPAA
jgi:hypothetical protein